jgi:hydroxyacylglutathione hydrolase
MSEVEVQQITVGKWGVNCYLIRCEGEFWLVDPGDEPDKIATEIANSKDKLLGILITHGHFDHVGAVHSLAEQLEASVFMRSEDQRLMSQANLFRKLAGGKGITKTPKDIQFLDDVQELPLGDKKIKLIHTPGHTKGGICLFIDGKLIVGDLIMKDAVGRADLPGGNQAELHNSIDKIISKYLGVTVFSGHGDPFVLDDFWTDKMKKGLLNGLYKSH